MGVAGGGGFSQDLAGQRLVPLVSSFLRDESWEASSYYLQRITVLRSCEALAKAKVGGQLLNDVTELVLKGLSDSVPNVRFSACETAQTLAGILEPAGLLPIKTK